jgi:hypothetical protein
MLILANAEHALCGVVSQPSGGGCGYDSEGEGYSMATTVVSDFANDVLEHFTDLLTKDGFGEVKTALAAAAADDLARHNVELNAPHWVCMQWFNLRRRRLTARPRTVIVSRELGSKKLPQDQIDALNRIEAASKAGEDLWPYLSRSVDELEYNDAMLNDWGVHHMHLGAPARPGEFVKRTGPLLFVLARPDELYFIDIFAHGSWADEDVVEILHTNWPALIARSRLNSMLTLAGPQPTRKEREQLRKAGATAPFQTRDGTIYLMLGGGYATSGMSIDAVTWGDRLLNMAWHLEDDFKVNAEKAVEMVKTATGTALTELQLHLNIFEEEGCLQVVEKQTKVGFAKTGF